MLRYRAFEHDDQLLKHYGAFESSKGHIPRRSAAKLWDCNPNLVFGSKTFSIPRPLAAGLLIIKRLQNPLELGWLWMLDFKALLPKPEAKQDPQEAKALAQFETEVEARRDYYQVGGRW